MNKYTLGSRSLRNLEGVHPDIVAAVKLAITYTEQDFTILDGGGLRTQAQADANAANGTGIRNSLHLRQPDGYGHAVDLVAWQNGKPSWDVKLYAAIHEAMFRACDELELDIQNGADWDNDGVVGEPGEWDYPHFQIPKFAHKRVQAKLARERRQLERARNA